MFCDKSLSDAEKVFSGIMAERFVSAEAIKDEVARLMKKNTDDIENVELARLELQESVAQALAAGDMAKVAALSSQFIGLPTIPVLKEELAAELAKRSLGKQFSDIWSQFVKAAGLQDSVQKVTGTRTSQANLAPFAGQSMYKGIALVVCHESLYAGDKTPFIGAGEWLIRYGEKRFRLSAGSKSPLSDGIRNTIAGASMAQDGGKLIDKLDSLSAVQVNVLL